MTKIARSGLLAVAAVGVLALAACGKSDKQEQGLSGPGAEILTFIPADSPYVMVTLEAAPKELSDKIEPRVDAMLDAYKIVMREALRMEAEKLPEDSEEREKIDAAMPAFEELMSILSVDGLKSIGVDRDSRFAMYGNGLLPVMRFSLSNASAFDAAIARIEGKAGKAMLTGEVKGQEYRYVDAEEARFIVGVFGNHAVLTIVPSMFEEAQLARVLGLELPAENIGQTGELAAIAKEFGYTNHMIGLISSERLAATFLDAPSGVDADLLALAEFDSSSLSDVCRDEIRALARIAPRMVTGYTVITPSQMDFSFIVELREDIAKGLATLPAPVPGLGGDHGGLMAFGMSINLKAAREFYSAQLDALEADPYECEHMAELQAGVASGRAALNQPVPPMVYDIRGFLAIVDDISGMDLANKRPPQNIDASLLLAVDNAPALLQLGAMFSPEIAALNLQPDGKPVEFVPRQLGGAIDSSFVALNNEALALSIGDSAQGEVGEMLGGDIVSPPPFMSMSVDAARYYSFVGEAMTMDGASDGDLSPAAQEAMGDMLKAMGEMYDRMSMDVHLTSRGVEITSVVTLGD